MVQIEKISGDAPYLPIAGENAVLPARTRRWHILVFLAPALLVYTVIMIVPLVDTLRLSLFRSVDRVPEFVGLDNFAVLFFDPRWSEHFWQALRNNTYFFAFHMLVQNPIGIALAALLSLPGLRGQAFYRAAFFLPTMLSFVIVGFTWKLILSPLWGVTPVLLGAIGLKSWFHPWLGQDSTALTTLCLISVWQYVGIPMMLIYAALLAIPHEVVEAAELDGVTDVHDLHAWTITSGLPILSAHVVVDPGVLASGRSAAMLDILQECLRGHFDVAHSTFQLEPTGHADHEPYVCL